ncbi:hypothetical protein CSHISOI_01096 [Colletotrichum shisoi]|uniref:Uncharacterized protein n=1 Tax=Colletotrichum shisoi TaxID=2078593 RepID=A0A5Q4C4Q8_9PEZI|nr:hypothetical protein CSHISOI_01096 [Colletotrichum shisoi]
MGIPPCGWGNQRDIFLCFTISDLATSSRGASSYLSDYLSLSLSLSLISLLHIRFSLPPLPDAGYMTLCSVSSSILTTIGGEGKDRNRGFLFLGFILLLVGNSPAPHAPLKTQIVSHYYQHTHTHTSPMAQNNSKKERERKQDAHFCFVFVIYVCMGGIL